MIRPHLIMLLPFVAFISVSAFAQEEPNEACFEPDKKTMKVLGQAESEKYTRMERLQFYTTALEMAPGNSYVYWSFAQFNYAHAETVQDAYDNGRANFVQLKQAYDGAAKTYKEVIFYCPEFNADAYYKLGFIYYLLNE